MVVVAEYTTPKHKSSSTRYTHVDYMAYILSVSIQSVYVPTYLYVKFTVNFGLYQVSACTNNDLVYRNIHIGPTTKQQHFVLLSKHVFIVRIHKYSDNADELNLSKLLTNRTNRTCKISFGFLIYFLTR